MTEQSKSAFYVGFRGPIDVLDDEGDGRVWVDGEIVRLLQVSGNRVFAFIRTQMGTGLYQL